LVRKGLNTFFSYIYIVPLENFTKIVSTIVSRFPHKGAFYTMIPSRIDATIDLWKTSLPKVTPYYAVKCNPNPLFLQYLYDKGLHFDCASERELLEITSLATTCPAVVDRIIYANPCKSVRDLVAAKVIGSPTTIVDSVEEVEKLAENAYAGSALVRIAVDDTGSTMPFSSKFGAPAELVGPIAAAAYRHNIRLDGISFHVGSGCNDTKSFTAAMGLAHSLFPALWSNQHTSNVLDIGGGFLANETDFIKKALAITNSIVPYIKVIAEPGRFFATNAFDFYVQVIGKKPLGGHDTQGWRYTLDDSIYGQFSNILFDHAKPSWFRVETGNPRRRQHTKGILFGRTCDSMDKIAEKASMEELFVGDWLCFPKMGAYTQATASEFNGFPSPEIFVVGGDGGLLERV
jgi:ornithine decarboxylase